ncbi:MAG: hypothetical protein EPN25_09310 [Nitrospirae bacterium]|nr:MAG: hypothetical protein EPN25_09310 [Nitrospirota bacterium]
MNTFPMVNLLMRVTALAVALCFSAACATSSKNINAAYVSPLAYNNYTCDQLRMEYFRISNRVIEVSGRQDSAAKRDAIGMGVGLVLFWPALFLLAGSKGSPEELARLKGECDALEACAIEKNCPLAQELADAKKKQQEIAKLELEQSEKEARNQPPGDVLR